MRSCGLSLLAACSACSVAPSLDVSVHHPPEYAVARTVVKVYVGEDIHCAEIQYGDLTEAELAAVTVAEAESPGDRQLDVGRLGGKSIVARGYDAKQRFVTAGCRDIGEIAGETRVQIDTQPTAVVAIDPGVPDRPFSGRDITVNMADVHGKALEGMVSWQLTGPAGAAAQDPSTGVPTLDGEATIRVDDLGMPGPQALRIRAPWAIAPLPLVTGFDLAGATTIPLPGGGLGGQPSCDVRGRLGKPPTLVCLTPADARLHRDAVEIAWQVDRYVVTPIMIPDTIDNQFALFVDHDGSASEPVYVLSANALGEGNWYRLGSPGSGTAKLFGGALQGVVYVPRCADNSVSALVGVQTGAAITTSKQQFFTPAGVPVNTLPQRDGEVISGGCIADVDKREHQAVMIASATGDAELQLITGATRTPMPIPGPKLLGSGFVTIESQGMTEKRFAGTRLQATGTVVFEAVLAPSSKGFKLVERTELEAAAPPTKIIGAKLDGDSDTDLMWDMTALLRRRVFQVSLAKQVSGVPLTGMTSGPGVGAVTANAPLSDFLAGDLDGQHIDEMVVFTANAVTIYSSD